MYLVWWFSVTWNEECEKGEPDTFYSDKERDDNFRLRKRGVLRMYVITPFPDLRELLPSILAFLRNHLQFDRQ